VMPWETQDFASLHIEPNDHQRFIFINLRDLASWREVLGITQSREAAKSFLLLARDSQ